MLVYQRDPEGTYPVNPSGSVWIPMVRQAVSVTELHRLKGFWLVRPDGSKAWPWKYFKAKIHQAGSGQIKTWRHGPSCFVMFCELGIHHYIRNDP